ncbi:hypothetical protein [Limnochorda pilosa]|uniref:hypothetical protein n=1 Tax=Limnochorda pilosa TaxID=1555112 RepID=UPI00118733F9|nr:hypothetical protein [Limnochorda pilosa]
MTYFDLPPIVLTPHKGSFPWPDYDALSEYVLAAWERFRKQREVPLGLRWCGSLARAILGPNCDD